MSEVLYRKWRPQRLGDVVGQDHVTQTLRNALQQGRVAHAYLFCGPRGTGKTSTGRILAKAVNCLKNEGKGEPCNECAMCQAVTNGSALDLIEIDAASNRGIDEIRDLRERVQYSPSEARRKVYIIDEVHMLTDPAFNALLKTLEEPPAHVIFVLATTEAHKLPPTIISRCQRFDFRRISPADVEKRLRQICQAEGIDAGEWVLQKLARASSGSLRDAENLLEQLEVSYGSKPTPDNLRELLGIAADFPVQQFVSSLLKGDVSTGLRVLEQAHDQGVEARAFQREALEYLRSVMMVTADAGEVLQLAKEEMDQINQAAAGASLADVTRALHLLGKLDLRPHYYAYLPLETALAEFCVEQRAKVIKEEDKILQPLNSQGSQAPRVSTSQPAALGPSTSTVPGSRASKKDAGPSEEINKPPLAHRREKEGHTQRAGSSAAKAAKDKTEPAKPMAVGDIEVFKERWSELVDALRGVGSKGSLDALLRNACEPVSVHGDTLVVGFYYPFHKNKIEDPKYRHLVEKKVQEVFGGSYKIRCDLVSKEQKIANSNAKSPGRLVKAAIEMGATVLEPQSSEP